MDTGNAVVALSGDPTSCALEDNCIGQDDEIRIAGEIFQVISVTTSSITLDRTFSGDGAVEVPLYKWAYGYEWLVTFNGALHVGDQDLMIAKPSNSWTGTNRTMKCH